MGTARTFKLDKPLMHGGDIENWQTEVVDLFGKLKIENVPITTDGVYGLETRTITATLCEAAGMIPGEVMKKGVTPRLRTRLRKDDLTDAEKKRRHSTKCQMFRARLRKRWAARQVATPVHKILGDSWGWHPGVHDGLDVMCLPDAAIYAMVDAEVIDVRAGGWWGLNPSGDVSKGDGIVQIRVLKSIGPFKKGMHIGYGHLEQPKDQPLVKVGQVIGAGHVVGIVGLAVTPHIHLMANDGRFGNQGRGSQDPRPLLNYAVKNS